MTVVQYEQPQPLPPSQPGAELEQGPHGDVARLRMAAEYAGYIGDTEFVPDSLRGRPAAIAAAIIAGAKLGLKPMVALRTVAIIKGRPSTSAEAQRGLVTSAGHELWFDETTTTRAIAAGRRAGSERIGRITWTMDDAKRAGIAGQANWRTYPAEMLRARASAALARAMFADVTLGIPATEELEDEPDNGPPSVPAEPAPEDAPKPAVGGRTRRRPARKAVEPTPPPDEQPKPDPALEPGPEPPATDAQKRQIFASMRNVGIPSGDRDARLAYTIGIIGRQIDSSNELTIREAGLVIDDLLEIEKLPPDQRPARLTPRDAQGASVPDDDPGDPEPGSEANGPRGGKEATAGDTQRDRIRALFFDKGINDESERLAYVVGVLDRKPANLDEITADEASQVIAHLEQYDRDDPQTWPFPDGF